MCNPDNDTRVAPLGRGCIDRSKRSRCLTITFLLLVAGFSRGEGQSTETTNDVAFFGDFRLRYENTSNQTLPDPLSPDLTDVRNRGVVRFRAGGTVAINDVLTFGGRVATGSSDDPNTSDATLGAFVDDIEVSLDQVYLALNYRNLFLTGGKFPNPFLRSDLVWDGDVNPQGVAGALTSRAFDSTWL